MFDDKCTADAVKKNGFFPKVVAVFAAVVTALIIATGDAMAALDLTGVTVDKTDFETIATFLITALVGFWGIKKGLSLLGR